MTEYEAVVEELAKHLYKHSGWDFSHWDRLRGATKSAWLQQAKDVLAVQTDTCRIAVVRINPEWPHIQNLMGDWNRYPEGYTKSQNDMIETGAVQELRKQQ
jgi:hypothetical protein